MRPGRRGLWGTRFGFYLAAIGSAFGLGNLWRFPYVTVENGGGAFVFLYIICALGVGLPLLIGELMLGKLTRRSVTGACRRVVTDPIIGREPLPQGRGAELRWASVGRLSVLTCLLILSYYAVISGWVLHFLMQFFVSHLRTGSFDVESSLNVLRDSGLLQIALASVHLLITVIIVVKGVQEGMEKWVSHAMPVFVLLLILLVMKSLSLSTATEALRFMFYPDFALLKPSSLLHAVGHVFFTLSIGFGTMVTFGSYLNERTHIPSAGYRVVTMDTLISLIAGLLVFPLLIGGGLASTGPELLFQTLPRLLADLESGLIFGMAFFVCLYLAALGASIGLLEAVVANVMDFMTVSRSQATWLTGGSAFLFSIVPALATSTFRSFSWQGRGLLEALDGILVNGFLPVAALGVSIVISMKLKPEPIESEFLNDDSYTTLKLYSHWRFMLRWLAPGFIIFAYILAFWGFIQR